ncbi:hypothetical protein AJY72_09440 [Campylobacter jejuni]|uniref:Uncharacterized protein n=1 Tax=Campylobacter jejuni TaxID=197 RepID=A0AB36G0D0_CAMJU|nr:hypothetical protein [Campylobacter jejuni]ECO3962601.1 hypothetical protein [Campylobacter jejuni]EHD9160358.1 hypothetical protein [Campylobacter jejuni]KJD23184.1 hypothetical protein TM41_04455 [Campylobacter jejuni subsp. jejuni]MEA8950260.1 hypothetical protein [Campylobacter jejuni]OEV40420.1 hypothetical protein AJY56_08400 [Campylobacter jejuni]
MKENISYENYEKNLKLQLESKRKDLDIQLTSVIPGQFQTIKLYMWLCTLIIAGNITILNSYIKITHISIFVIILFGGSIASLGYSVFFSLIALKSNNMIAFPQDQYEKMSKLNSDNLEHTNGINAMISSVLDAFNKNNKIINNMSEDINKIYITLIIGASVSFFAIIASGTQIVTGEIIMSDNKEKIVKPTPQTGTTTPIIPKTRGDKPQQEKK